MLLKTKTGSNAEAQRTQRNAERKPVKSPSER